MMEPSLLILASGSATGGGSGFAKLVENNRKDPPVLDANIVGVASNHAFGGVAEKAHALSIPFAHFAGPFDAKAYQRLVKSFNADWVMLSGWLKMVVGLDPARVINIHPGPFPLTRGMHGDQVHAAVLAAYHAGKLDKTAVNVHFIDDVDGKYDTGSVAYCVDVDILPGDTVETLRAGVNVAEHAWQSHILNLIVHEDIILTGDGVRYHGVGAHRLLR